MAINKEFESEQIELISDFLFKILFPENFTRAEIFNFDFDESLLDLKLKLNKMVENKQFVEAENLVSNEIESSGASRKVLQIAVWFYLKVDEFDDGVLQKSGFSKYDVLEGLKKIESFLTGFKN